LNPASAPASIIEERVVFGRNIPAEINACLQQAVACADDFERARELFYRARDMAPDQLEVYIALYKFCFYRGHFAEAEQVALDALAQCAARGRFAADWQLLDATTTDWSLAEGPARVYLYSLKALAFIRLRTGEHDSSRNILTKLQQLDPQDQVGGSVITTLAEAL
jgi:tetratricopeptide (TPR) repeat protein